MYPSTTPTGVVTVKLVAVAAVMLPDKVSGPPAPLNLTSVAVPKPAPVKVTV